MDNKKLFVGNLPWSLNNDSLKELFAQFGEVVDAVIIKDRDSGRSKGFGFVTFATEEEAKAALSLNEKEIEGRNIVVNVAKPREDRGGFGGGRGGGGRDNFRRGGKRGF